MVCVLLIGNGFNDKAAVPLSDIIRVSGYHQLDTITACMLFFRQVSRSLSWTLATISLERKEAFY